MQAKGMISVPGFSPGHPYHYSCKVYNGSPRKANFLLTGPNRLKLSPPIAIVPQFDECTIITLKEKYMRICMVLLTSCFSLQAPGQEQPAAPWKHGVVAGLTMTQVSYTDWAQGGENSLSYATSLDGKSAWEDSVFNWTNDYKFAFGQSRLGSQGLRKTDDKIDIASVLTYKVGKYVNPYTAVTIKTQFARGFTYDATGAATEISAFLDPAFLTQSVGAGYQATTEVKTRLGLALREVITTSFNQYADDPTTPVIEKVRVDGGLESVTDVEWLVMENIQLTSQLELFAAFRALDEIILRNDTAVSAKVNEYITVIFNVQTINERQITPRTQIKETLALGINYTLL